MDDDEEFMYANNQRGFSEDLLRVNQGVGPLEGSADVDIEGQTNEVLKRLQRLKDLGPLNTFATQTGRNISQEGIVDLGRDEWFANKIKEFDIDVDDQFSMDYIRGLWSQRTGEGRGKESRSEGRKIYDDAQEATYKTMNARRKEEGYTPMEKGTYKWMVRQEGGQHTPMGGMTSAFRGDWPLGKKK